MVIERQNHSTQQHETDTTQQRRGADSFGVTDVPSDLTVDGLLGRLVREAARLCGACRGVFDVVDARADRRLGQFASFGLDEDITSPAEGRAAMVKLAESARAPWGSTAYLGVPVLLDGHTFANLYLFDKIGTEGFDAEDEEAVTAFAASAGLMISAALQHEKTIHDRRWMEASSEISSSLLGRVSYEEAWQLVVDRARSVASATCAILLLPDGEGNLVGSAVSGTSGDGILGRSVPVNGTLIGRPSQTGHAVVVERTELDRRYDPRPMPGWPALQVVQILPLPDGSGQVGDGIGTLVIGWTGSRAVDSWELDPESPERFAEQSAQVLRVAREQGDQRQMAVAEDRGRISRDLHDVVIQRLFAIGLALDQASYQHDDPALVETLTSAVAGIDETIADLRRTISSLEHGDVDVEDTLRAMVDHVGDLLGFEPELTVSGPVVSHLTVVVRDHLVAVAGEMLSNIVQHARATAVSVSLTVDVERVVLTMVDNGVGIDPEAARAEGNGLRNMRRRAELLGGSCDVVENRGGGVTITWSVPGVRYE